MRLAILADPIDNQHAGIHVFTKEMVEAMIRNNPGHEIILIREKKDAALKGAEQISIWNTRLPIGFASIRLFILVPLILHFKKIDAVLEPAHFGPFNLSKRIKRITIIHDLTPILFPKLHRWHSQILQKIFLKKILDKADLIIANSDNTAKDIGKVYPQNAGKVNRIYPGISDIFKPAINNQVLEKYNINTPYFLFVGTIEPRKNLLVLLDAFRIFMQANKKSFTLVIAGGIGWKSESFFHALKIHPHKDQIICTGFVESADLPPLYSQATALIYPSVYEGFGLPIVESMSCGTPVITSDNSSLYEAGGKITYYFNANDAEALSKHMVTISNDPSRRNVLAESMQKHLKKFNWDSFAQNAWTSITDLFS
jgi:glycosyltransferase involved in cell wall biosynthesis